jgi:hypothetical protein
LRAEFTPNSDNEWHAGVEGKGLGFALALCYTKIRASLDTLAAETKRSHCKRIALWPYEWCDGIKLCFGLGVVGNADEQHGKSDVRLACFMQYKMRLELV